MSQAPVSPSYKNGVLLCFCWRKVFTCSSNTVSLFIHKTEMFFLNVNCHYPVYTHFIISSDFIMRNITSQKMTNSKHII